MSMVDFVHPPMPTAPSGISPRVIPARDPLRDVEWFAAQIGRSADWVQKNLRALPRHMVGNSPRFDDHCLDVYRIQTFMPPADMMSRTALSKKRGVL